MRVRKEGAGLRGWDRHYTEGGSCGSRRGDVGALVQGAWEGPDPPRGPAQVPEVCRHRPHACPGQGPGRSRASLLPPEVPQGPGWACPQHQEPWRCGPSSKQKHFSRGWDPGAETL